MKTALLILTILLLIVAVVAYVLGHIQIAFGIGFLLIVLFISSNAYFMMENREYLRKKSYESKEKELERRHKK